MAVCDGLKPVVPQIPLTDVAKQPIVKSNQLLICVEGDPDAIISVDPYHLGKIAKPEVWIVISGFNRDESKGQQQIDIFGFHYPPELIPALR